MSMRVNQRYFALRDATGQAAPYSRSWRTFLPVTAGRTIVAGNERVLRARFADARHFWDLDRSTRWKAGAGAGQGDVPRQSRQPGRPGKRLESWRSDRAAGRRRPALAGRAAALAKADLTPAWSGNFRNCKA